MTRDQTGVLAAVVSSAIGGIAGGATRFVVHATDPVTLGVFRFGTGFLILLPIALLMKSRWPKGRDWVAVAALGILFFFAFSILFNLAYTYTTAARGALTLSTMPLMTMLVGAALGIETLTVRKTAGVLIAMTGVLFALAFGLSNAPAGAWRGELVMFAATFCMSLYNVWSRPFIARSDPLAFLTAGMGAAAFCLLVWALAIHGFDAAAQFGTPQWLAIAYLGVIGSAGAFILWVFALSRTSPTKTAVTITVNPVFASIVGAVAIGEGIGLNLIVGLAAVAVGIWLAAR
ncbi:MAG TPA: DMT family transporter [Pseudolabrys sp.]|jgi:drug/metabolite transporter (DMT)-like permease|nr:DMT family transporter [Pseudolabrys sp.]